MNEEKDLMTSKELNEDMYEVKISCTFRRMGVKLTYLLILQLSLPKNQTKYIYKDCFYHN